MQRQRKIPKGRLMLAFSQHLFIAIAVMGLVIFCKCKMWDKNNWDFMDSGEFLDSFTYLEQVTMQMENLSRFIRERENFETNHEFDGTKVVDVLTYAENGIIDGIPISGQMYSLETLSMWASQAEEVEQWHAYLGGDGNLPGSVGKLQPIGYASMEDFVASPDNIGNLTLEECRRNLLRALCLLSEDLKDYTSGQVLLGMGHTNFHYAAKNTANGLTFTNTHLSQQEMLDSSQHYEYRTSIYSVNTNISLDADQLRKASSKIIEELGQSGQYTITVMIDTGFPVKDIFQKHKSVYTQWQPYVMKGFWMLVIGGLIALAEMFCICIRAGRYIGIDEIVLESTDTMVTEVLIILSVLTLTAWLGLTVLLVKWGYNLVQILGSSFMVSLFSSWFFQPMVLALVRKYKAGILGRDSILWGLSRKLMFHHSHWEFIPRFVSSFACYCLANILFLYTGGSGYLLCILLNLGVLAFFIRDVLDRKQILHGVKALISGNLEYKIDTEAMKGDNEVLAKAVNQVGSGLKQAVSDQVKNERLTTELITNVSHDIRTPLTSIISYIGLIKREEIYNPKIREYVLVLETKAERLKYLMTDLIEASRIASGMVELDMMPLDLRELLFQMEGEFSGMFQNKHLEVVHNYVDSPVFIMADGNKTWRIMENIFNNIYKYTMPDTRIYLGITQEVGWVNFLAKNISQSPLNFTGDQLIDRFIRGDVSRNTEGSGLGLSIASSLTKLQGGEFKIYVDGDLFKVIIRFPLLEPDE